MIDSFIAGKHFYVDLDGHASITGGNASGKTTFLLLLPIFFGAEPRQVEIRAAGRDSFVDHYLPRLSSLIIFEYERVDGACCAILYRHPTSEHPKLAYRFLKGGFSTENFSLSGEHGEPRFYQGGELRSHWQSKELKFSRQLDIVTDYRAVIQNDSGLLRRSLSAAENRRLARDFCLGDGTGTMQHIEKICIAIQNQHGNLEKMKAMLSDIMTRDGVTIPSPPHHPDNIALAERIQWLSDFERQLPAISQVLTEYEDYLETQSRLGALYGGLRLAEEAINKELDGYESQLVQLNQAYETCRNAWESKEQKLRTEISGQQASVSTLGASIDQLYKRHDEYEREQIQTKISHYQDLDRLKALLDQATDRVNQLNEAVATHRQPFDQQEKDESERHIKAKEKLDRRKEKITASAGAVKEKAREQENFLHEEKSKALEESAAKAGPERNTLVEERSQARVEANSSARTEEEEVRLTALSDAIERINREREQTALQLSQNEQSARNAKQHLDDAISEKRRANRELLELSNICEKIREMLYADGTWLSELRRQDPKWWQGIGKTINPELFLRKDLAPNFKQDQKSCFGWDIDLSVLEPAEAAASEEELTSQLTQAELRREASQRNLEQCEKQARKRAKKHKDALKLVDHARLAQQRVERRLTDRIQAQATEKQQISEATAHRKTLAKKKWTELEDVLIAFDKQHKAEIEGIRATYRNAIGDVKASEADEISRIDQEVSEVIEQIGSEKSHHKQRIAQIWSDFDALCSERGVETSALKKAESERNELKSRVEEISGYAIIITEYREWIESQWSRMNGLKNELGKSAEAHRVAETRLNAERTNFENEIRNTKAKRSLIQGELTGCRSLASEIENTIKTIGIYPDSAEVAEGTPRHLLDRANQTQNYFKEQEIKVSRGIKLAENVIERGVDEKIKRSWVQLVNEKSAQLGKDFATDPDYWRHLPPLLDTFINDIVPTMREALIQTIRSVGGQLTEFFYGLSATDRRIGNYSRTISEAIKSAVSIEAISDINIQLSSKISDLEYWTELEHFSKEWSEWTIDRADTLPDRELVVAMGVALIAVQKVRSSDDLQTLFDLTMEITENGRTVFIKSDNDLLNVSSRGLSYLALFGIFIGLTHYLCDNRVTPIHWPVDELGMIDRENTMRLFEMLERANIRMLAAFPSGETALLGMFHRLHEIDRSKGIMVMQPESADLVEGLMNKRRAAGEVSSHA
ncbi:MAG: ATP-binding protein [Pseudomonadota bacterium]|nr:ATP-binding protein [Pseudomonadota bacterium]